MKELREEIMEALKHLKIRKAPGPTEVYAEMIPANGDVGIRVLIEICQSILDGNGMPEDRATSVAIPMQFLFLMEMEISRTVEHIGL